MRTVLENKIITVTIGNSRSNYCNEKRKVAFICKKVFKFSCIFSLVVDDVDSHSMSSGSSDLDGPSNENSSENSSSQTTPLDSPGGPREKIKQMQVEAETRRGEFARLLEEHAQVVRKLKMMEAEEQLSATGNVVGATHA